MPPAMSRAFGRFACIDWSGARGERLPGIAVAECEGGDGAPRIVLPPGGRFWSRMDAFGWLAAHAMAGADIMIGIDFSPAFPFADRGAYFPGLPDPPADARALWADVERRAAADPHLAATSFVADPARAPCFRLGAVTGERFHAPGRNGRLRLVEQRAASGRPTSAFNLVGAAQVGLSSLTGMRLLHRLQGRVPVWPFDPVPREGPLIVEIYTSIAARQALPGRRGTKMRTIEALNQGLAALGSAPCPGAGPIDDHRSDALLTAAWLRRAAADPLLWRPEGMAAVRATEGWTFGVR